LLSIPLQSAAAVADFPRQAAYNVGPALVGRAGQGPQTGAEMFQRAGLDYDVPWQRALGAGAGAGMDMLANPLNLIGMGAGGAGRAAPAAEGALARRLERMVAPVSESNAAGRQAAQARIDNWMQGVGHPDQYMANRFAASGGQPNNVGPVMSGTVPNIRPPGSLPFSPPTDPLQGLGVGRFVRDPVPAGTPGSVQGFAPDVNALRSLQLNSARFNPDIPAFGLGTRQFTQDASQAARLGLGEGGIPLSTARLMPGAEVSANPLTSHLQQMAGGGASSRLDRMLGRTPPTSPTSMANEGNATMARRLSDQFSPQSAPPSGPPPAGPRQQTPFDLGGQPVTELEREALRAGFGDVASYRASRPGGMSFGDEVRAGAGTIPPNRAGTVYDPAMTERMIQNNQIPHGPWQPAPAPQLGPAVPPAPATSGTPAMFPTGANQPPELGGLNLRAAWEAIRGGRGRTLPMGGGDTFPNGPIDY
jgi:hypothetical protein